MTDFENDLEPMDHEVPSTSVTDYAPPEAEALIRRTIGLIDAARPMPLSTSSMINKEEVLELLNEAVDRMPDELRAARWLMKEREEYLAKVRREGDDIIDLSKTQAARMVERTEVVRAAEKRAREIIEAAEADSRRMRLETEDFCDQKLGSFENVLERTMQVVQQGRSKLQRNPLAESANGTVPDIDLTTSGQGISGQSTPAQVGQLTADQPLPDPEADAGGFFDQDGS